MKEKLYYFSIHVFLILKYFFINIRKYFIKAHIKLAKHNWFISKNRNFYNPILEATVYKYGSTWSIARHGNYFGAFQLKEDAMDEVFKIWLSDKRFTEIAEELEHELKNIKHKILNEHKYRIIDQQLNKAAQIERESNIIRNLNPKRIMIFGPPGCGKSTFASFLASSLDIPLRHFDEHFYIKNWDEEKSNELIQIQQDTVNSDGWIIDKNSTHLLEIPWAKADLVLYFNCSKIICIFRVLKRFLEQNIFFDYKTPRYSKKSLLDILKYIWVFEEGVDEDIKVLKKRYPHALFKEIRCEDDLNKLNNELV